MSVPSEPDASSSFASFAAVAETHSGVVFFFGERAYKLKRPVRFGFLDFTRREVRQTICRREVELNRRLAPDVYLGVADVVGPDGSMLDHLVVMRRLPPERRLESLAAEGERLDEEIARLARLLADFHARAESSPVISLAASRDALSRRWEDNAEEMAPFVGPVLEEETAEQVMTLARRYLAGREPLFAGRLAAGRARDGHGDLLAGDIFLLPDGPRVLDCLEFDDELRYGDVLSDVAFLAMDLERLGRPELSTRLLGEYGRFAGDSWPSSLAHHYVAYRAQVRAKVACLRSAQGDEAAARQGAGLLDLSLRHLEAGRVRLLVVGGLPGTGKSTLAAGLSEALGGLLIRSDEVRKELAGLEAGVAAPDDFEEGLYRPAVTEEVYAELGRRAGRHLSNGESVILDASFTDPARREAARRLAADLSADLDELCCVLPDEIAAARIRQRAERGGDPSDATVQVAARMARRSPPWPSALELDTSASPAEVLREAVERLEHKWRPTSSSTGRGGKRDHRP